MIPFTLSIKWSNCDNRYSTANHFRVLLYHLSDSISSARHYFFRRDTNSNDVILSQNFGALYRRWRHPLVGNDTVYRIVFGVIFVVDHPPVPNRVNINQENCSIPCCYQCMSSLTAKEWIIWLASTINYILTFVSFQYTKLPPWELLLSSTDTEDISTAVQVAINIIKRRKKLQQEMIWPAFRITIAIAIAIGNLLYCDTSTALLDKDTRRNPWKSIITTQPLGGVVRERLTRWWSWWEWKMCGSDWSPQWVVATVSVFG